ncbi:hypothetical protein D9615_008791 [Tricholomella constricta]|uniref:Uncharacterized protein n=1 Tax=Tricholomella constricta TaxID=117010 RepID=A0A8H5H7M7_9AGAR|nr:hypothetical protein D9615_008791 [Tricholomella constricta]
MRCLPHPSTGSPRARDLHGPSDENPTNRTSIRSYFNLPPLRCALNFPPRNEVFFSATLPRRPTTPTPLLTRRTRRANPDAYPLTAGLPHTLVTREPSGSTTVPPSVALRANSVPPDSDTESDSDHAGSPTRPPYPQTLATPSTPAPSHVMESSQLAEVRTAKMKDCPVLTAGKITPLVLQSWALACKRYKKHAGKSDSEIVSFVAEAMLEPRLVAWYQAGQARIDALSLQGYLDELAALVLEKNWAHKLRDTIISSKQGARPFIDWKIELENLNAILTTSSPSHALTSDGLKVQLEANLNTELKLNILNEPVLSTKLDSWTLEVKEHDDRIKAEDARTQRLIDANAASRAARRSEKKDLLSRITDPQPRSSKGSSNNTNDGTRRYLPKLTDSEKRLLADHEGCSRCRKFYAGHRTPNCPLTAANAWPDVATYVELTLDMANAAKPKHNTPAARIAAAAAVTAQVKTVAEHLDNETDSYVNSPFTVPHLVATLDASGPNISDFPIPVAALLDIGCPSTVISRSLVDQLGLQRRPLPRGEDNLSSLSSAPLTCTEYVKLELTSGRGAWKSGSFKAKVHDGLPVPIILGMPFLASRHLVIHPLKRTACDERNGYDLMNPPHSPPRIFAPERITPPPTPKKERRLAAATVTPPRTHRDALLHRTS